MRNLIAMDGATSTELVLIDDRGCPAETSIMSELRKSKDSEKILMSSFDAFRFPSSDMVQVNQSNVNNKLLSIIVGEMLQNGCLEK